MNRLNKKLTAASSHITLSDRERNEMRQKLYRAMGHTPTASPVRVTPSPFVFMSQRWMVALASLVIVVFAGGTTVQAAQGSLPGQPLYALKTKVVEPVMLALATDPAAKAQVHVALAQRRVEEAEALAQQGTLDATTSDQLAANFETHAQSADAIATAVEHDDPVAAVQIKTQLNASATVGSAVLVALAREHGGDQTHVDTVAARVLALAGDEGDHGGGKVNAMAKVQPFAATAPMQNAEPMRTMAVTATGSSDVASATEDHGDSARTAGLTNEQQGTAAQLSLKAQAALDALKTQFAAASSTLDATTTVSIQQSVSGIEALIQSGTTELNDSIFDTAIADFTQAYSRAIKLQALLRAQQQFDHTIINPILKLQFDSHDGGDSSTSGDSGH